jgi:uncharacterized membrane protein YgcG
LGERQTQDESRVREGDAGAMKCPSCGAKFSVPAPECPHCKLTLRRLDAKFGAVPRHSRYITDRTRRLSRSAIEQLRKSPLLFGRKFPQSLFSVFLTDGIPPSGSISEYAFWLANRAHFDSLEAVKGQNFNLLLVVDLGAGAAALVCGYALENYLTEHDLQRALAAASSGFQAGDIQRGLRNCVEFMINRMRQIAKDIEERK